MHGFTCVGGGQKSTNSSPNLRRPPAAAVPVRKVRRKTDNRVCGRSFCPDGAANCQEILLTFLSLRTASSLLDTDLFIRSSHVWLDAVSIQPCHPRLDAVFFKRVDPKMKTAYLNKDHLSIEGFDCISQNTKIQIVIVFFFRK